MVNVEDEVEDVAEDKDVPSPPGSAVMDPTPTLEMEDPVNVKMDDVQSALSLSAAQLDKPRFLHVTSFLHHKYCSTSFSLIYLDSRTMY